MGIRIINTKKVTNKELDQMWALYAPHHNVTCDFFMERMYSSFNKIAIFYSNNSNNIVGFTGLRITKFKLTKSKNAITIYLGQTFIDKDYRGKNFIQLTMVKLYLRNRILHPLSNIYIWNDSISYKPYLLMAHSLKDYYPSLDTETPACIKQLTDFIGKKYYAEAYNPQTGTVIKTEKRLKSHVAPIDKENMKKNRHLEYYATRNTGYLNGDGLICIAPATIANLKFFMKKIKKKKQKRKQQRLKINQTVASSI